MRYFCLVIIVILCFSCREEKNIRDKKSDPLLLKVAGENYEEMLRFPVGIDGSIDTNKMPRISFNKLTHNLGSIKDDQKQQIEFTFTNSSAYSLYVLDVSSSCGCTIANYTEGAIKANQTGKVVINYDPSNRVGVQEKKIFVTTNAFPNKVELTILADVLKK